jgi:hypothetical protein
VEEELHLREPMQAEMGARQEGGKARGRHGEREARVEGGGKYNGRGRKA